MKLKGAAMHDKLCELDKEDPNVSFQHATSNCSEEAQISAWLREFGVVADD